MYTTRARSNGGFGVEKHPRAGTLDGSFGGCDVAFVSIIYNYGNKLELFWDRFGFRFGPVLFVCMDQPWRALSLCFTDKLYNYTKSEQSAHGMRFK